jgi:hypothetical protein
MGIKKGRRVLANVSGGSSVISRYSIRHPVEVSLNYFRKQITHLSESRQTKLPHRIK